VALITEEVLRRCR